jgi:hypothetical protein
MLQFPNNNSKKENSKDTTPGPVQYTERRRTKLRTLTTTDDSLQLTVILIHNAFLRIITFYTSYFVRFYILYFNIIRKQ